VSYIHQAVVCSKLSNPYFDGTANMLTICLGGFWHSENAHKIVPNLWFLILKQLALASGDMVPGNRDSATAAV